MDTRDPLDRTKQEYEEILKKIASADSPVGIDASYTHAVIIEYLRQISARLERLERLIEEIRGQ